MGSRVAWWLGFDADFDAGFGWVETILCVVLVGCGEKPCGSSE